MISDELVIADASHSEKPATRFLSIRTGLVLDIAERCAAVALYSTFAYGFAKAALTDFQPVLLLFVVSEILPVLMIVTRRFSVAVSHNAGDWALGFAGASAPLLVVPATAAPIMPAALCAALIFGGVALQIFAKLALGRSFGIVAANRGVRDGGPYRMVRHPMYAGYTVTHIGCLLISPSLTNTALYAVSFMIEVVRILREEQILGTDPQYRDYAKTVRYRLLPGVF